MIAKKFKLPVSDFRGKKPDFSEKFPNFRFLAWKSGRPYNRFGIVIGKKTAKTSAKRHYILRRAYDMFGTVSWRGADVIIYFTGPAGAAEISRLKSAMEVFLQGIPLT